MAKAGINRLQRDVTCKDQFVIEPHYAILEFTRVAVYSGWEKPGETPEQADVASYRAFGSKEDWERAIRKRETDKLAGHKVNDYVAFKVIPAVTEVDVNITVDGKED